MDIEEIRNYCIKKPGFSEGFPFNDTALVFKVAGKMFLLASLDENPLRLNLKCDPEKALELREEYESVIPGYHMNKKMWNTVILDRTIPNKKLLEWIDNSYNLVVAALKKSEREALENSKARK